MPIARIKPKRVGRFRLKPKSFMAKKVPTSDTGMAAMGMRVERMLPRKTNTTRMTSAVASKMVLYTSSMAETTKFEVS